MIEYTDNHAQEANNTKWGLHVGTNYVAAGNL